MGKNSDLFHDTRAFYKPVLLGLDAPVDPRHRLNPHC